MQHSSQFFDVAVVGLGPNGLRAMSCIKSFGLRAIGFERGHVGQTVRAWPPSSVTQSAVDDDRGLQIEGAPLERFCKTRVIGRTDEWSNDYSCSRDEYVEYLQNVPTKLGLDVRERERVHSISRIPEHGHFRLLSSRPRGASLFETLARFVVLALGSASLPQSLDVPGSSLPHVVSPGRMQSIDYYRGRDVAVVGGGNSAIEIANALCRQGAQRVLLVCRSATFQDLLGDLADGGQSSNGRVLAKRARRVSDSEIGRALDEEFSLNHPESDAWIKHRYFVGADRWDDELEWYSRYVEASLKDLHKFAREGVLVGCSHCEVRSINVSHLRLAKRRQRCPVALLRLMCRSSAGLMQKLCKAGESKHQRQRAAKGRDTAPKKHTIAGETVGLDVAVDDVIVAIGGTPDNELLETIGLPSGNVSSITGETSVSGIYAVGFDPLGAPDHHKNSYENWLAWGDLAVRNTCRAIVARANEAKHSSTEL